MIQLKTTTLKQEDDSFCQWATTNNMELNVKKTKKSIMSFLTLPPPPPPPNRSPLTVNNGYICAKTSKRLYALRTLRGSGVPSRGLCSIFCYLIRRILEYACPVWHSSLTVKLSDQIEAIQRRAVKTILPHLTYDEELFAFNLTTLCNRGEHLCRSFYHKIITNLASKLSNLIPNAVTPNYNFRKPRTLPLFKCRTKRFKMSFLPYCVKK